jgi:DnaJ-class molecular chaperone
MENILHESGDEIGPLLEQPCSNCFGKGYELGYMGRVRCCVCDGSGYEPTEFGKRVLSLMRHNFKPMLHDAQDE